MLVEFIGETSIAELRSHGAETILAALFHPSVLLFMFCMRRKELEFSATSEHSQ